MLKTQVPQDRITNGRHQEGTVDDFLRRTQTVIETIDALNRSFLNLREVTSKLPNWARPDADLAQLELELSARLRSLGITRDRLVKWQQG